MVRPIPIVAGLALCAATAAAAADATVKPLGVFPLAVPALGGSADAPAKAVLWCGGSSLFGLVVPEAKATDCGTGSAKHAAPRALLLRDGRCNNDGAAVSFGFLESRKAWVYEASKRNPGERTVWLLYRFEGSAKSGQLKGSLVQVDVNHPGSAFSHIDVDAQGLTEDAASYPDEAAWRTATSQAYCVARQP